jgi:hypothetical protein
MIEFTIEDEKIKLLPWVQINKKGSIEISGTCEEGDNADGKKEDSKKEPQWKSPSK